MGSLDFLFEGKPPASVTTYGQTVENMPKWLSDFTQGLIARGNAVAAEPYQQYQGPRTAGFSPDQQAAFGQTRANQGNWQPGMNAAMGYTQQAGAISPLAAASPYLGAATAPGMGGSFAAMPYAEGAAQTFTGDNVSKYMDPYVGNVIDRAANLATRNYDEKIMPGLNDRFTSGGQYGSSAHLREANRAARDVTSEVQSASQAALSQAYQTAGQLFGADAGRQGQLASTMGQLGVADQQALLQAGQTYGTLAGQEGQLRLSAGEQMGNLSSALQAMGIRDAAALEAIGSQYQGLAQRNLDTAYQDWQTQRDYPRSTVEWMSSLIRGLPFDKTTNTSQTGPANVYQPSPLSQLAGLGSVIAGMQQKDD